ncbi:MAG TPA: hypothetical protein IGS52_23500, partial [Oscillatoriaceae cyanobacterium M33_DOE_052]|nr:hypothetical protein [Oscillatoriaceae cyanobacterium M33_DOE_052]
MRRKSILLLVLFFLGFAAVAIPPQLRGVYASAPQFSDRWEAGGGRGGDSETGRLGEGETG